MLLNNEVEVIISRRNVNHYRKLGYDIPILRDKTATLKLIVKSSDVPHTSKITYLDFECDNCHKQFKRLACAYYGRLEDTGDEKTYCIDCASEAIKATMNIRYGVDFGSQVDGYLEKRHNTCLEKYGVIHPLQDKRFVKKAQETCMKKYGVKNVTQLPESRERSRKLFLNNGLICCSAGQKHIAELVGAQINYLFHGYYLDALYEDWLDIEYDGSGHDLRVKRGTCTQSEFDAMERKRYAVLHSYGLKTLTIKGNCNDILPSDDILKEDILSAVNHLQNSADKSFLIDYSKLH